MAGYDTFRKLVAAEFTQSCEEGRDAEAIETYRTAFESAGDDAHALNTVYEALSTLPLSSSFFFDEPSDLAGIRRHLDDLSPIFTLPYDRTELLDRLYGAWLGRCAGCALGKPVEAFLFPQSGLSSKGRIRRYLEAISPAEYPIRNYFPAHSPAEAETGSIWGGLSTRETIAFMESDDDIRYTVLGQILLRTCGTDFTTLDVANTWINTLPYRWVCTAETQAYRNIVARYPLHTDRVRDEDVDWNWVATYQNPYREWIGAQIRADTWGYAAPGDPRLAATFAWRDARLSHVKNGIYGAMFCAAMIAAAFALDRPLQIVEAGLAQIPPTSRLAAAIRDTIALCETHGNDPARFEAVLDGIYARLGDYAPVHTINNAALVVAALLLGGQDFEQVITIAVMGGWDTDCNGATAGSIAGAMRGARRLPARWIEPLQDTLNSQIIGYHPIPISECARRSLEIVQT